MRLSLLTPALLLFSIAAFAQQDADLLPPGQKLDRKPPQQILDAMKNAKTHGIGAVAISPDGGRVAWVSRTPHGSRVEITELQGMGSGKSLSAAADKDKDCSTEAPVWAPDGGTLAVLSDCSDGKQQQVYLSVKGGELKQAGTLKGYIEDLRFAPDGKAMTFLYMPDATGPAGATSVQRWPEGIIGSGSRQDIQRLAWLPMDGGAVKLISPETLHIYEYSWMPDGTGAIYTAAAPPGENNWWVAKIYAQPVGGSPRVVFDPGATSGEMHGLQIAVPRLSPDGSNVAFIGGLMSDFGSTGGDVYVVPAAGGEAKNLTHGMRSTAIWVYWMDGHTVGFSDNERGESSFRTVAVTGGEAKTIYHYDGNFGSGTAAMSVSFSDKQMAAVVKSSITDPPEVWAEKGGDLEQITHVNTDAKSAGGKTESFTWKSGGYDVQGFVTYPSPYDPNKSYPMIVNVHGGPAAAVVNSWSHGRGLSSIYSMSGYFVFEPNDRGSFGQGEAFVQANRKDFGYGDLQDALAGVDALEKRFPIDDQRIGLTGGSYGGFMSMFAPTQTHRFAASVAVAGISDWLSYYGENSIDQWMIPYFGASVYDDPAVYAKQSAISFIKQEKTPMLIIVGDRDGECPPPQSFEMWHALRDLGVDTELVVYPNEGHGLSQQPHQMDYIARSLDWFAKYMPAK